MTTFLRRVLWPAFALLIAMTVITGAAYPAVVTAVAQVAFPRQANGSMIVVDGKTIGSSLIGQCFDQPKYFWGRPSAAGATTRTRAVRRQRARRARTWARPARSSSTASPRSVDRLRGGQRRRAGPGRPGHHFRLGPRSGHQPGRR